MDQPKIERLLKVMMFMMEPHPYTIVDMAKKLNVNRRTVYRYVESLKEAGFCVEEKKKSVPKFGKKNKNSIFKDISQIIYFTDEEAHIFNQLLDRLNDTSVQKQNLRKKLTDVYTICTSIKKSAINTQHAQNVQLINESVKNKKLAILKNYASSHSGKKRDRLVEVLEMTPDHVQMWCFDVEDMKNKLFNVTRVESVEILDTDWQFENLHQKGTIDIFRTSDYGEPKRVVLKLSMMARNLLTEEFPFAENCLSQTDENHWLLDTQISNIKGVGRFVMGLLDEIEIIESAELKQYIEEQLKRFSKVYGS